MSRPIALTSDIAASICLDSFEEFTKELWDSVPGSFKVSWNWHMSLLCQELQEMAERVFRMEQKQHDLAINISPGSSKSSICSILFPAWVWARDPKARVITASNTDSLVINLSAKTRYLIESDQYQEYFPWVELRKDQKAKGDYATTEGGERFSCTVAGKAPIGRHCHFAIIDDPLDPQAAISIAERDAARHFMNEVIPSRQLRNPPNVAVLFLIMQRVHLEDPTGVLLARNKLEGAGKVKHICIPCDNTWEIHPLELKSCYGEDGLMDPVRLPRNILKKFEAEMGSYGYAAQFGQNPTPMGGGMFKPEFFTKRVKAAPYGCPRIIGVDRASTGDGGCYTAMLLMADARQLDGYIYIENVVHGQWEPDERDQNILRMAQKYKAHYGPKWIPKIVIERETGSTGKQAFQALARMLIGFSVSEQAVTGSKDVRAEPWASQLAAGTIKIVDDGSWDVEGFIQEHLLFRPEPGKRLGRYKDQVDAATLCFNLLANPNRIAPLKIYAGKKFSKDTTRIVVCSHEQLEAMVIDDHPTLLIYLDDPEDVGSNGYYQEGTRQTSETSKDTILTDREIGVAIKGIEITSRHGLSKLLEQATIRFADLDPADVQDRWDEPILPWNRTPKDLIMTPAHGNQIRKILFKERKPRAEIWVIADAGNGDRRAISVAHAICYLKAWDEEKTIYCQRDDPEDSIMEWDVILNKHVVDCMKAGG